MMETKARRNCVNRYSIRKQFSNRSSSVVGSSKANVIAMAPTMTKAYPSTASSRGRMVLLTSLGLNLVFILWASNHHFLEGTAALSSAQSDCQNMDSMQTQELRLLVAISRVAANSNCAVLG